jgi:DNA-binding MurR/RpiR family transcriptional regulator
VPSAASTADAPPAASYDELRGVIAERFATLPGQLQRVARIALERPHDLALKTVAALAADAGVQPSTLVRFANALGFGGFSAMQQLFQSHLVERSGSYRERIAQMRGKAGARKGAIGVLHRCAGEGVRGLEQLVETVPAAALERAVRLLCDARRIDVLAYRRSFPVACYLAYALNQLELPAHLLDGVGGMNAPYAARLTRRDVLLAVSFPNYTDECVKVAAACHARGVSVVSITDGPLSPLHAASAVCLEIGDQQRQPFRSLVEPLCLAEALVIAAGHRLAANGGAARPH